MIYVKELKNIRTMPTRKRLIYKYNEFSGEKTTVTRLMNVSFRPDTTALLSFTSLFARWPLAVLQRRNLVS